MKMIRTYIYILITLLGANAIKADAQCNVNTSICSNNAGPFNFVAQGPPVSSCLDFLWGSQVSYIMLYITQTGPLNLLINGNGATGFLDVAIFRIPNGQAPCNAIQNLNNEIGCNYASSTAGGCTQFGTAFGCNSSVPAPIVNAGDVLMIVVENWSGTSTNYTLTLAPNGAQSGTPNAAINNAGPFCVNASQTQLTAVNMGGTWSGPGVTATGMFNPTTAGVGTHTITYSIGTAPCQASSTTQIVVNPVPTVTAANDGPVCSGLPVNLTATSNDPSATFTWTPGGMTGANATATPTTNTTYTVTATSQYNCSATATTAVNVLATLPISVNSPSICYGDSVQLTATGGNTYNWSNGMTGATITVAPSSTQTYTVNASANNGCVGSAVSTVTVKPLPVITANSVQTCPGVSVTLSATGATNYSWSDGQYGASVSMPGVDATYTVIGELNGCVDSTQVSVSTYSLPDASFSVNNPKGCSPLSISASLNVASQNFSNIKEVVWYVNGSDTSSLLTLTKVFQNPGCQTITAVVRSNDGCVNSYTDSCAVFVTMPPVANFSTEADEVEVGTEVQFTDLSYGDGEIIDWDWSFGNGDHSTDQNPSNTYSNLGEYLVVLTVVDEFGCDAQALRNLKVVTEVIIYIPNTFTPDEDKLNDYFVIKGSGLTNVTMSIFTRWGEPIIRLEGDQPYNLGWDGKLNGNYLPQGVYLYKVEFVDKTGKEHLYIGNINLIR